MNQPDPTAPEPQPAEEMPVEKPVADGELSPAPRPKVDEPSSAPGWHGYDHSYDRSVHAAR
jgi:hypothetical protein